MSVLSLAASAHRAQGGAGFACVFSFAMGPKKAFAEKPEGQRRPEAEAPEAQERDRGLGAP